MSATHEERKPVLGPGLAGTLMTPEEFDAVEEWDEDYRYELIQGVLIVTPVPLPEETGPNELLGRVLMNHHDDHPQGSAIDATLPEQYIRVPNGRRRADRLIWTGLGRMPNRRLDVPTIVVEFVSRDKRDRQRDYVEKRAEHLALGILEYWVIDRFRRMLTVFRNGLHDVIVPEGEVYRTELLPGFELPVGRLLAEADAWEHAE